MCSSIALSVGAPGLGYWALAVVCSHGSSVAVMSCVYVCVCVCVCVCVFCSVAFFCFSTDARPLLRGKEMHPWGWGGWVGGQKRVCVPKVDLQIGDPLLRFVFSDVGGWVAGLSGVGPHDGHHTKQHDRQNAHCDKPP